MKKVVAKYPRSMMYFHHIVAILMIASFVVGKVAGENKQIMPLHKSIGLLLLIFAVIRIVNRLQNRSDIPATVNQGGKLLAEKVVHSLLIIMTVVLPVAGWLTSNFAGRAVSFFGLFDLPTLVSKNEVMAQTLGGMHKAGAMIFLALLVIHVFAVFYHKIKAGESVMSRMLPW